MTSSGESACRVLRSLGIDKLAGAVSTGSGQALRLDGLKVGLELDYDEIPGLSDPSVPGHAGRLRVVEGGEGYWAIWIGRRHFYQGYSYEEIGLYIDISSGLGADRLICINAAGGLDPSLRVGDLLVVERYRCFIPIPGRQRTFDGGPWTETSKDLADRLESISGRCGIRLLRRNYVGVPGPTYETAAEVAWLRSLGCHVVGMSTVPELLRAKERAMKSVALSAVANVHGSDRVLRHEEVVEAGRRSVTEIDRLMSALILGE